MSKESTISIFVKTMRVHVRIGLEDFERTAPQPIDVSVELFADVSYLADAVKGDIIDYAKLHDVILSWEQRGHVELIEAYLQELLKVGFSFERVTAVRARISKPEIFNRAEGAGVEICICRKDWVRG